MSDARIKAFIVQERDSGAGYVWFARSDIEARKQGAEEQAGGDIQGVSCRRCPDLDGCEDDARAVTRHLLAAGWCFEADDGGSVTIDDSHFVSRNGRVYKTWMAWLAERERHALSEHRRRAVEAMLWGMWPWAEQIHVRMEPSRFANADIRLPYLRDSLRWCEREDKWSVAIRDVARFRAAYSINPDGAVPASHTGST